MTPQVGQVFETGDWYATPQQKLQVEQSLVIWFAQQGAENNCRFGEIEYEAMPSWHQRAPSPPPESGMWFLAGRSRVIWVQPTVTRHVARLTDDLEPKDLDRMRHITRQAYRHRWPGKPDLTDQQTDDIINAVGPESAIKTLRDSVDSGYVN